MKIVVNRKLSVFPIWASVTKSKLDANNKVINSEDSRPNIDLEKYQITTIEKKAAIKEGIRYDKISSVPNNFAEKA